MNTHEAGPSSSSTGLRKKRGASALNDEATPPDPYAKLAELVKLTCTSGEPAPPPELLRGLKRELRRGDGGAMERTHDELLRVMGASREVGARVHAVTVCDELFARSAQFRALIVDHLDVFLAKCVGCGGAGDDPPLPGPPAERERLITLGVSTLEGWTERFGVHYPRLGVARRFVEDTLGEEAPAARAEAARRADEARGREAQARLCARWRRLEAEEMPSLRREVGECTLAISECLGLLLGGRPEAGPALVGAGGQGGGTVEGEEDEWEDVARGSQDHQGGGKEEAEVKVKREEEVVGVIISAGGAGEQKVPGVGSAADGSDVVASIRVAETAENAVIIAELRGLCRTAATRLVPALADALALLGQIVPGEGSSPGGGLWLGATAGSNGGAPPPPGVALSGEERAGAVNVLAAAKRSLIAGLDRCKALGLPVGAGKSSAEESAAVHPLRGNATQVDEVTASGERGGDGDARDSFMIVLEGDGAGPGATPGGGEVIGDGDGDGGTVDDGEDVLRTSAGVASARGDGDNATLDALLVRAARRRRWESRATRGGGRGGRGVARPGASTNLSGGSSVERGNSETGGSSLGSHSVRNRARRILASQVSAHNAAVLREMGEAGQDRRDAVSGASERRERAMEARASAETVARVSEEEERRLKAEAKRRKTAGTPKQRIEARLKGLGKKRR